MSEQTNETENIRRHSKKAISSGKENHTAKESGVALKKEIGILQGVSIIVGAIVGSGIFVSPVGVLKHTRSVGLSFVLWIICGGFSALGAIVYAELGVTIPRSGGEFIYILKTFGPLPAFLCLWITFAVIGAVANAANSLIFAQYVLLPFFGAECEVPQYAVRVVAVIGVTVLCAINCYNVKWATKVAVIFTISKVSALLIITFIGCYYLIRGHTVNFQDSFEGSELSVGPMAMAFYQGFWAYAGWNYLNFLTEEMKNPARSLPIAIMLSLAIVTVVYLFANVAYLAVLSPEEMLTSSGGGTAVALIFSDRTMGVMSWIMPIFVGASVFGSMNGEILSMSRLAYTGSQEGHMPELLSMVSYRYLTPIPAVLTIGVLTFMFQMQSNVFYLIELVGFAFSVIAAMAVSSLLYLRYKYPNMKKAFKLPLIIPILFLIFDVFIGALTVYQQPWESFLSLILMLLGIPIYLVGVAWTSKPEAFVTAFANFSCNIQKTLLIVPSEHGFDEEDAEIHCDN